MEAYDILGTVLETDYSDSKRGKQGTKVSCSHELQKLEQFHTKK